MQLLVGRRLMTGTSCDAVRRAIIDYRRGEGSAASGRDRIPGLVARREGAGCGGDRSRTAANLGRPERPRPGILVEAEGRTRVTRRPCRRRGRGFLAA